MNSIETFVATWSRSGWLVLLAFTASTLVVGALRKPCRRIFGAERAFLLWLLPPMAMFATLLPHALMQASPLPPVVFDIVALPGAMAHAAADADGSHWQTWAVAIWVGGVIVSGLLAVIAQLRYRAELRDAQRYGDGSCRWRVLRAADPFTGPALVGAWQPRIVVPADFDERYDENERRLILAHEAMHARRLDGIWALAAQIMSVLFWFHPLAWWALPALRHDQELACDAGVLRENRGQRRNYAKAMLKTSPAGFALPVGCAWSPRHPLTARIAMLKQAQPGRVRRASGALFALIVILCGGGATYAVTAGAGNDARSDRHTLKLELSVDGKSPRLHANICLEPGEPYRLVETGIGKLPPWRAKFWVEDAPGGMLEVHAEMEGGPMEQPSSPRLRTHPRQTAVIEIGSDAPGGHTIKVEVTPRIGC
jgi:beta-lactamase regulating signal transducer with metallopeptidase domain